MNIYELRELVRKGKIKPNQYYKIDTGETFLGKSKDRVELVKKEDIITKVNTELSKKVNKEDSFKNFTFDSNGNLTKIEVFKDSDRTKLSTIKTFNYDSSGNLIIISNEFKDSNTTEIKTFSYDTSGNIENINIT